MIVLDDNLSIDENEVEVDSFPAWSSSKLLEEDLQRIADEDTQEFDIAMCRKFLIKAADLKKKYDQYGIPTKIDDFMAIVEQVIRNPEGMLARYPFIDNWCEVWGWTEMFDSILDQIDEKWPYYDKSIRPVKDKGNQSNYCYYKVIGNSILLFDEYCISDVLVFDKNKKTVRTTVTSKR